VKIRFNGKHLATLIFSPFFYCALGLGRHFLFPGAADGGKWERRMN